jgi:hypothetical protein
MRKKCLLKMSSGRFTGKWDYNIEMNSTDMFCKDVLVELFLDMVQWQASLVTVINLWVQPQRIPRYIVTVKYSKREQPWNSLSCRNQRGDADILIYTIWELHFSWSIQLRWMVGGSNPGDDKIFSTRSDLPSGPPSFLYKENRLSFQD